MDNLNKLEIYFNDLNRKINSEGLNLQKNQILTSLSEISPNQKHILWFVKRYISGKILKFEDFKKAKKCFDIYNKNQSVNEFKYLNLESFNNVSNLEKVINIILERNKEKIETQKIIKNTEVIYSGEEGIILYPKTQKEINYWSKKTEWITQKLRIIPDKSFSYIFIEKNSNQIYADKYKLNMKRKTLVDENNKAIKNLEDKNNLKNLIVKFSNISKNKPYFTFINSKDDEHIIFSLLGFIAIMLLAMLITIGTEIKPMYMNLYFIFLALSFSIEYVENFFDTKFISKMYFWLAPIFVFCYELFWKFSNVTNHELIAGLAVSIYGIKIILTTKDFIYKQISILRLNKQIKLLNSAE